MALSLEQFAASLNECGLLSTAELSAHRAAQNPTDAEQLARSLVKQKLLTAYQAQQAYAGRAKALLMGNYLILDKLGQGGMGMVLKARHKRMNRIVALKVLSPAVVKTPDALARFHREVQAAARLEHQNIVIAYDADEANGTHFFVMQYVEGSDLSSVVKKKGVLAIDQAIHCVTQAARGLDFAHKHGVIHRDIKPANLLLDNSGTVKILDMGLARIEGETGANAELTSTGAVMGTIDYMAPEQAMSTKSADGRSDIYSLGVTLWYLLVGRPMYEGESLMARLMAHANHPIPSLKAARADVPPGLDAVYQKMVAKKPADRYQSMADVIAALDACQRVGNAESAAPSAVAMSSEESKLSHFLGQFGAVTDPLAPAALGSMAGKPTVKLADQSANSFEATVTSARPDVGTDPATLTSLRNESRTIGRKKKPLPWWTDRRVQLGGAAAVVLLVIGSFLWTGSEPTVVVAPTPSVGGAAAASPAVAVSSAGPPVPAANEKATWIEELPVRDYKGMGDLSPSGTERFSSSAGEHYPGKGTRGVIFHALHEAGDRGHVTFATDGRYETLEGVVYCRQTRVEPIFGEILGDGVSLWKSPNLTLHKSEGIPFKVKIHGVKELTLVGQAEQGNFAALFGWMNLRLDGGESTAGPGNTLAALLNSPTHEWSPPVNFGAPINSPEEDMNARFTPNGLGLYFTRNGQLFVANRSRVDAPLDAPRPVPRPSGWMKPVGDLFVSPDEKQLFFATWDQGGPVTLRRSTRTDRDSPWSAPALVRGEGESGGFPVLSADGLTLYFASFDEVDNVGGADVFSMSRPTLEAPWSALKNLGPAVNSAMSDRPSWVSSDECVLLFQSSRGSTDQNRYRLFMTTRPTRSDDWGPARPIGPPAAGPDDSMSCGTLSSDGTTLCFESTRDGGLGQQDIWMSRLVPKGTAAPPTSGASGDPVNLLEGVAGGVLTNGAGLGSPGGSPHFFKKIQIPDSYTLTYDLERLAGSAVTEFFLIVGGRSCNLHLHGDGTGPKGSFTGLALFDGLPVSAPKNPTSISRRFIPSGKPFQLICQVQPDRLRASVDGVTFLDWQGDASRLSPTPNHATSISNLGQRLGLVQFSGTLRCTKAILMRGQGMPHPEPSAPGAFAPPSLAVAPFDSVQAKQHQAAWAENLATTVETTNSVGAKMVLIPPGEFLMGATEADQSAVKHVYPGDEKKLLDVLADERPQHRVRLTKPFAIGKHEVSRGEFRQFVEAVKYVTEAEQADPGGRSWKVDPPPPDGDRLPITMVTKNDAQAYCEWLTKKEGRRFALPTEAQWEYVCRAGTQDRWAGNESTVRNRGWIDVIGPQVVGKKEANPFGIHDLQGNVQEWCQDDFAPYGRDEAVDPIGLGPGRCVIRGGNFRSPLLNVRPAKRGWMKSTYYSDFIGFRVIQILEPLSAPANSAHRPAPRTVGDLQSLVTGVSWGFPRNLGSGVNSVGRDLTPTLSADELHLVFTRDRELFYATRTSRTEPFGQARSLAPRIHSDSRDLEASLSGDGLQLVYTVAGQSDQPPDLWMSSRKSASEPFGEPIQLPPPVNTSQVDRGPVLSEDGLVLLVSSNRPGTLAGTDVWLFRRPNRSAPFGLEQNLGKNVNSGGLLVPRWISNDRLRLVVVQMKQAHTNFLHTRSSEAEEFGPGVPMTLGTGGQAIGGVWLSPDENRLYFHSRDLGGSGQLDLFMMEREPVLAGAVIDLLSRVDLPRDSLKHATFGDWTREGSALVSPGSGKSGRIQLRYEPPLEYELTAVVERVAGADGVMFGVIVDGYRAEVGLDVFQPGVSALSYIDGKAADANETTLKERVLGDRKPHTVRIMVGRRSVRASLDGRELVRWEGDPARLTAPTALPNPKHLWFGAAYHQFRFHKLELRPLSAQSAAASGTLSVAELLASSEYEWTAPESLGPVVNAEVYNESPFLTADGLELWKSGGGDVFRSTRTEVNSPFGPPVNAGSAINLGDSFDCHPALSVDRLTLLFASDFEAKKGKELKLWMSTRPSTNDPFPRAVLLPEALNEPGTLAGEPSLTEDQLTLVFQSNRPGGSGDMDLWQATRTDRTEPFGSVTNLGPSINSTGREDGAWISPDGLGLIFSSERPGTRGLDLFVSTRPDRNSAFEEPIPLGAAINGPDHELSPCLSHDGTTLLFQSDRPGGQGKAKIWMSRRVRKSAAAARLADPEFQKWMTQVAALPPEKQLEEVSRKLVELNPKFDGKLEGQHGQGHPVIRNGVVKSLRFATDHVTDISPLAALKGLEVLQLPRATVKSFTGSLDLSPLRSLKLKIFDGFAADIASLEPLRGMPLIQLYMHDTQVEDLTPLAGMPLSQFWCQNTQVKDLKPLEQCPNLKDLNITAAPVTPESLASFKKSHPQCEIKSGN
jgi:serine/threonine protein kinase/formylglycine-generating enzyme required for sulfatase activity